MLALRRFISDVSFEEAKRNLDSNQSVVRVAALSKLEGMPVSEAYPELVKMLNDPIRSVRTEAARLLSRAPHSLFSPSDFRLFQEVFEELKLRYTSNLDRPESYLSLGILAENQNLPLDAEKYYRQGIRREDTYVPARMNLATLLSRRGKNQEAEKFLREAVRLQPTWGQVHYSLGLLLAEDEKRISEAIRSLERASAYWQENPRVFNNLAIAYWKSEEYEDAIISFRQASRLQPDNPEFLQNLVQLLLQQQRWNEALPFVEKIVELLPNNPQYISLLSEIKGEVMRVRNSK